MYNNFIHNKAHGFVFAYVPKVACTNWKSILRRLNGAEDWLDSRIAHDRNVSGLDYFNPEPDAPNAGLPEGVPVFTMVRDPYARALSAYLNKVEARLGGPKDERFEHWDKIVVEIDTFRKRNLDTETYPEIDFEVFLRWLRESGSWSTRDEHWAPQSDLLAQPYVSFEFVGRFEAIATDSAEILQRIGADVEFPSQKQVNFAPTHAKARLDTYLTEACRNLIEDVFAADFINFKYEPRSGRDLSDRAREAELKKSLIFNRFTGFVSVAKPFGFESFVQDNFARAQSASPKPFAKFLTKQSQLGELLKNIAGANDQNPVKVFDIGAFMGAFAAAAKHTADQQGVETDILCVEPNPRIIDALSANLSIHGIAASVVKAAIGFRNGQGRLGFHVSRMLGGRVLDPTEKLQPEYIEEPVDVLSLADILPLEQSLSLVKLDISGLELAALRSIADSPKRLNNVFIIRVRKWQLDKAFEENETFLDWLNRYFKVVRVKDPTLPKNDKSRFSLTHPSEFSEPVGYVLAVPRAHEALEPASTQPQTDKSAKNPGS
ncbi:FkbM family methyltransferase [Maricaulaceae bacterium EIL42A08]|nr:FkbM family methyltransferase [Maricaulaceae bacterium EIL42A08]